MKTGPEWLGDLPKVTQLKGRLGIPPGNGTDYSWNLIIPCLRHCLFIPWGSALQFWGPSDSWVIQSSWLQEGMLERGTSTITTTEFGFGLGGEGLWGWSKQCQNVLDLGGPPESLPPLPGKRLAPWKYWSLSSWGRLPDRAWQRDWMSLQFYFTIPLILGNLLKQSFRPLMKSGRLAAGSDWITIKVEFEKEFWYCTQFSQISDLCVAWKLFLRLTLSINEYYM